MKKLGRLFLIKTRLEAWAVIYAITLGAVYRGIWYVEHYPGAAGWVLFLASTLVVFVVGGFLLDHIPSSSNQSSAIEDLERQSSIS